MDDLHVVMELIESESEDEELDAVLCQVGAELVRSDRNRIPRYYEEVVARYFDYEFKRLFRLSRDTFKTLAERFKSSAFFPTPQGGRPQIPAEKTCLIALSYLGTQNSMYRIADTFDVSESSVSLCLKRVLDFLFNISEEVIAWPSDQERANIKARFLARSNGKGPRNTIGCVDGCHIEIPHQKESPASYYNRKKFPSIVLQGICDSSSRFIDVFVGYPGCAHDARVLKESPIYSVAETKCANDYLLGDAAYPLLPWLMPPYKDNRATFERYKRNFNKIHSQQRVAIEHAFGLLKQRFRRLYLVDADSIDQCCLIVLGACVLHNLCSSSIDMLGDCEDPPREDNIENENDGAITSTAAIKQMCELRRQNIAETQC
ncbi:uncharacterized protein LOC119447091 [Dermacentor silvarum]|uniref:uncharacterized protein LOC119447091 n=1 Tax=Dermacentor silvarum TaxID=543639 RepID=UPI00189ADA75|nr:uncharacterized protein LOC119447091 [Dermacentor silvarum]